MSLFMCVCSVWLQVPALHPLLHGGGGLYGVHAHASQGQRALQDLRHGQLPLLSLASDTYTQPPTHPFIIVFTVSGSLNVLFPVFVRLCSVGRDS